MKLYLISQDVNNGYGTYDSAVVAAKSPSDAKKIHPSRFVTHIADDTWMGTYSGGAKIGEEYETGEYEWVRYSDIDHIEVEYLGKTLKNRGIILASFNAG